MTSKIFIATAIAVLSLATTAFAAEGGGNLPGSGLSAPGFTTGLDNATLPENGSQGAVQSPNSLPPGFYNGTVQELQAQARDRWFASQAARYHYAQVRQAPQG